MHPLRWPRDPCDGVRNAEHRGRIEHAVNETREELPLPLEVEHDGPVTDIRSSRDRAERQRLQALARRHVVRSAQNVLASRLLRHLLTYHCSFLPKGRRELVHPAHAAGSASWLLLFSL